MARCCSSFQNWSVSSPFCSGYHMPLSFPSDQQWWSCSQALSCALHSSCDTSSRQWRSCNNLDSSHGCQRLHTKTIFHVSHLPLSIDYLFVDFFEHTNSSWWSRRFGDCFFSYALPGLFFFIWFLFTIMATICSVFLASQTASENCRGCNHHNNRVS